MGSEDMDWGAEKGVERNLLEEAFAIVTARGESYGHPSENFRTISLLWGQYLSQVYGKTVYISPRNVALMMALVKIARDAHKEGRDNLLDLAGYAWVADVVYRGEESHDNS